MPVITITRQYGSLGDEIGSAAAERLHLRLVDHTVIAEVAKALGLPSEKIQDHDEWQGTIVSDLVRTMRALYPASNAPLSPDREPELDEAAYLAIIQQVIREVARGGDAVIVGRGAAPILRDDARVLHVSVVAPLQVRVERVVVAEGLDQKRALQRIEQADERRARYIRRSYGDEIADVQNYDLVLNTGRFDVVSAASIVCEAALAKERLEIAPG